MKKTAQSSLRTDKAIPAGVLVGLQTVERREWWLWAFAVLVTLLLTLGIASFVPALHEGPLSHLPNATRGLVGLVLLFDIYTIYQQLQIHRIRRRLVVGEELFRLITENAVDMIAVVDANGHRLYNSPSYRRVLGYSDEELQATSSLDQIHIEDRELVKAAARDAIAAGTGRRIEYRMLHKDGGWRTMESTASPVLGEDGKVAKLVIVNRDITERRKLEDQLRQAQKMDAIGRLSGGIAHDFNNLLGIIIGYGELLEEDIPTSSPQREGVEEILKAGRKAASLTRQLLAFSRQQMQELKILDLNLVVSDVQKMLQRMIGEDIDLTTRLDSDLGKVKVDQSQVEQVILNLAVNARDAMPQGGKLFIETANAELDEVFARQFQFAIELGAYVCLTVTDTGTGMDATTQSKIFEPFFTTKEKGKGTGLGLATVYGVVKQSGGYISVYSEVGLGTTFKIYFRRVDPVPQTEESYAPEAEFRKRSETILLVEDEAGLRNLTRNLLERLGYRVLPASHAKEALEVSRRHNNTIHLMLTDVVMPGVDGRVLAQEVIEQRPDIKVVYMSGYTGQTFGGHAILDPGTYFLMKPFTRDSLACKIREALDSTPMEVLK
jgi:two-component system cell cycle sensor histidine kinase/response regulator CckA